MIESIVEKSQTSSLATQRQIHTEDDSKKIFTSLIQREVKYPSSLPYVDNKRAEKRKEAVDTCKIYLSIAPIKIIRTLAQAIYNARDNEIIIRAPSLENYRHEMTHLIFENLEKIDYLWLAKTCIRFKPELMTAYRSLVNECNRSYKKELANNSHNIKLKRERAFSTILNELCIIRLKTVKKEEKVELLELLSEMFARFNEGPSELRVYKATEKIIQKLSHREKVQIKRMKLLEVPPLTFKRIKQFRLVFGK